MKRALVLSAGIALGLGIAFAVARVVQRAKPQFAEAIADEAREVAGRVRSALQEGREAMGATEAELRSKVLHGGT
ncbi:MAG: hypothetical protein NVSMB32_08830 [Actinomycetota bacterium]